MEEMVTVGERIAEVDTANKDVATRGQLNFCQQRQEEQHKLPQHTHERYVP